MQTKTSAIIVLAFVITLLSGCLTSSYYRVPSSYQTFQSDGFLKANTQRIAYHGDDEIMVSTYDDEYFYDSEGNLVKFVQTEYFDFNAKEPRFLEWEVNYTKLGSHMVPQSLSVNGVVYAEVDYEILPVETKGVFAPGIRSPYFQHVLASALNKNNIVEARTYNPSVEDFDIGFPADNRFVKQSTDYNLYRGFFSTNVLTMGYDNVVLTRLFYSNKKLIEGMALSETNRSAFYSAKLQRLSRNSNVEFIYEWEIIAEKICATSLVYNLEISAQNLIFTSAMEYDDAGRRISETWTLLDPARAENQQPPLELFQQELIY